MFGVFLYSVGLMSCGPRGLAVARKTGGTAEAVKLPQTFQSAGKFDSFCSGTIGKPLCNRESFSLFCQDSWGARHALRDSERPKKFQRERERER